ncbi:hypothetical protein PQJ75_13585 [Rhodoplanes sp. TEM]|uniref:Uncharacterized protein n=1 Tax=Rhodoplanes tepidamans TaxID=200616 RepID=A0ABT5JDC4_RHOTP|nr:MULTISPECIES: hypothetical protein [Rhodoplanes]MDC7787356.1 hypothetical protein [Rhodoplanes tepidamans]MDC7984762.1 hypothetical protein [Rhodoplanes sp. TEM]MDQ0358267.1 hypothetical protein [Rhodoplanes tepidamans]
MAKKTTSAPESADTALDPAVAAAPAETTAAPVEAAGDDPRTTDAPPESPSTPEPAAGSTPAAGDDPAPAAAAAPRFFLVLSPLLLDGALHAIGDRVGLFPAEIPALQAAGVLGEDVTADL